MFSAIVTLFVCSTLVAAEPEQTPLVVPAIVETQPVQTGGDAADDACVWVDPKDATRSLIIGTDKKRGLITYTLDGSLVQEVPDGLLNNVDIRHSVAWGGGTADLVVATNTRDHALHVYQMDHATRLLAPLAGSPVRMEVEPYGCCLYLSPVNRALYAFVTSKSGRMIQVRLFPDSTGALGAELLRSVEVGSQCEGCVADDALARVFVGEESTGVWRYGAEPNAGDARVPVDQVRPKGQLVADVEGVTLLPTGPGAGYLLVSSQDANAFMVYRREDDHEYLGCFTVGAGGGIDAVTHTDGIDASPVALGPNFPEGIFIAQDDEDESGLQNFKLVSWGAIRAAFAPNLRANPGHDPRKPAE
jgi:3-phytase